ncbi:nucleoside hydrolase [Chelativorans sp. AA-79]|uniref:nucleoside hydrolase n=1 Tax=Chelativorans sp. AA-79 TaxID=3028735 RepID=UPI0023F9E866|nr:nucleoside hydrolase [Chelativorans sp. AA-79]WEX10614.1 nucleoside hydrolase [Chelativorans sp. AA-79]
MKVLIDTDPGIDDAIALLFALAHPKLEVAGITTVAGNIGIETTTRNALRILALAGADVPVHAGTERPLARGGVDEIRVHGQDGLGGVRFPDPAASPAGSDAVGFLRDTLMAVPDGTVDILALGPLTNIARLVTDAPEAARRVRQLIAMGGAVHERGNVGARSEFNIAHDPEAAEIVFSAGLPFTLIPLDVTRKVRADRAYLDRLAALGTPAAFAVRDLIAAYFDATTGGESRPLHDPCVPILALHPELFTTGRMALSVDCSAGEFAGALGPGRHMLDVAMKVEAEKALDLLASVL